MPKNNLSKQPSKKISSDILKIVFSEKTPFQISEICIKNRIEKEEKIEKIAHQVGRVLLGELPPDQLQAVLEKEVGLDQLTAKKVAQEISKIIFLPVKSSLGAVYDGGARYKIKIGPPAKPKITPPPEEKPKAPPGEDVYRESVE
jgi:hypothetical protein